MVLLSTIPRFMYWNMHDSNDHHHQFVRVRCIDKSPTLARSKHESAMESFFLLLTLNHTTAHHEE